MLREELEYFVIPPKGGAARTDLEGLANEELMVLKREAGKGLLDRKQIFTALQRNVNKENNVAEQHLIDMLCMRSVHELIPFPLPPFDALLPRMPWRPTEPRSAAG